MTPNSSLHALLEKIKREEGEEAYHLAIEKLNEYDRKMWKRVYLPLYVILIPTCIGLMVQALIVK